MPHDDPQPAARLESTHGPGLGQPRAASTDRERLERWVRAGTTSQRVARRSRIVLLALDGVEDIATRVGVSAQTVKLWIRRFEAGGAEALLRDAPGRGRRATLDHRTIHDRLRQANLLTGTGQLRSLRRAAVCLGVSPSALWRALQKASPGYPH